MHRLPRVIGITCPGHGVATKFFFRALGYGWPCKVSDEMLRRIEETVVRELGHILARSVLVSSKDVGLHR